MVAEEEKTVNGWRRKLGKSALFRDSFLTESSELCILSSAEQTRQNFIWYPHESQKSICSLVKKWLAEPCFTRDDSCFNSACESHRLTHSYQHPREDFPAVQSCPTNGRYAAVVQPNSSCLVNIAVLMKRKCVLWYWYEPRECAWQW